jgi:hypothetical protein
MTFEGDFLQHIGFYQKEHKSLREELHDLKNCQVTFLTFSITATALLLGLFEKLSPLGSQALFYLIPLIVLLPSWCIFFEKATTITRIVGYNRILENLILNKWSANDFRGWENTLAAARVKGDDYEIKAKREVVKLWSDRSAKNKLRFVFNIFFVQPSYHRYWALIYDVFFLLSWLCLIPSLMRGLDYYENNQLTLVALTISVAAIVYVSWTNMKIVYELIDGKHSYRANEHLWKKIISINE